MFDRDFEFAPGFRLRSRLGSGQFGQVWEVVAPGEASIAVKFVDLSGDERKWRKEYEGIQRVKQVRAPNLMPILAVWVLGTDGKSLNAAVKPSQAGLQESSTDFDVASHVVGSTIDLKIDEFSDYDGKAGWLAIGMLLGGKNLEQRRKECFQQDRSRIPPDELLCLMEDAAKGIDFLNGAGRTDLDDQPRLQHGDIKPENIVLIGQSAVVCDFGLARIVPRDQIAATSVVGTAAYMSPETIRGKPSRHSDQYSLAITYYYLRTGGHPFSENLTTYVDVANAHLGGKLNFDNVPYAEKKVLTRATAREWNERYDSCQAMVRALRQAIQDDQIPPPPPWWRRPRIVAAGSTGVAVVALIVVALIIVSVWLNGGPPPLQLTDPLEGDKMVLEWSLSDWTALLEDALNDVSADAERFDLFLKQYPALRQPMAIRLIGHSKDVEQLFFVGDATRAATDEGPILVTRGLDPIPRIFDLTDVDNGMAKEWDGVLRLDRQFNQVTSTFLERGIAGPEHSPYVMAMACSNDGRWIASGAAEGHLEIWATDGQQPMIHATLALGQSDIATMVWHPTGDYLLVADLDQIVYVITPALDASDSGVPDFTSFQLSLPFIEDWQFDHWGESLLILDVDGQLSVVEWKAIEGLLLRKEDVEPRTLSTAGTFVTCMAIAAGKGANASVVAAGDDGEISMYSLPGGRLIDRESQQQQSIQTIAIDNSSHNLLVVTGGEHGELVLSIGDGGGIQSLAGHGSTIYDIAISPDGEHCASVSRDGWGTFRSLRESPKHFVTFSTEPQQPLTVVAWDPTGRWLITGGYNGSLTMWDARHLRLLLKCCPQTESAGADFDASPEPLLELRESVHWRAGGMGTHQGSPSPLFSGTRN